MLGLVGMTVWAPPATATADGPSPRLDTRQLVVANSARSADQRQLAVVTPPAVAVGGGPEGMVFDAATHTLYTDNQDGSSVSVVDTAACDAEKLRGCHEALHTVTLTKGASPQGIVLDKATDTLYVTNYSNTVSTVSVIDARTCNATDFAGCGQKPAIIQDPGGYPAYLGLDQVTDTVYVANYGNTSSNDTVSVINGASCNGTNHSGCGQIPPTVTVGGGPSDVTVDPVTDTVYVANQGFTNQGDTVSVINGAICNGHDHAGCGQHPAAVTVGKGAGWVQLDPATHTAYTANETDSTVSAFNTAICNATDLAGCHQKALTIAVGSDPWAITVDQRIHTAFVANRLDDTVSAINTSICNANDRHGCGRRPASFQVGRGPRALATDQATGTLYVANTDNNTVSVITADACDAANTRGCRHEPPTATVGAYPSGIDIDQINHTVYVANQGANTISVINAATCSSARRTGCAHPVATVRVGHEPAGVAVDPATGTVYVANQGGDTVSVIDAAACNAIARSGCDRTPQKVRVGAGPSAVAVDQATDTVYVANYGPTANGDTVSVIDGATCNGTHHSGCGQTPPTVRVRRGPLGVAINPATDTVYVADTGQLDDSSKFGHTVSVIDGATCNGQVLSGCRKVLATVTVGSAPLGIAADERTNKIYVADNQGGEGPGLLSVINGASCDASDTSGCSRAHPTLPEAGWAPNGVAVDPTTDTVYAANIWDATVSVINVDRRRPQSNPPKVAVGSSPISVAIDRANHTIYVVNGGADGTVSILPAQPVRTTGSNI